MFSTSADILNLILGLCIIVLTFFLSWAIYYLISSVQRIHKIIKRVEAGVTQTEEIIATVRNKLKNGSAYLMVLAEVARQALEFVKKNDKFKKDKSDSKTKAGKKK